MVGFKRREKQKPRKQSTFNRYKNYLNDLQLSKIGNGMDDWTQHSPWTPYKYVVQTTLKGRGTTTLNIQKYGI